MSFVKSIVLASSLIAAAASPTLAAVPASDVEEATGILKASVSYRTVEGNTPQFLAYARYLADTLKGAGYTDADIKITPTDNVATFAVRLAGRNPAAKPIILSGHMDVVEAKREDWERDPFTAVIENGFLYGRGSFDNKYDVAMMVETMMRLKRMGFKPGPDVILVLSGDEETVMASSAKLAEEYKGAGLVLNGDGGGGTLGADGKPIVYGLQAGEKTYADFTLTTTDEGGHSSRPDSTNAIYELAQIIDRIAAYQFPVQWNELTLAYFKASAKRAEPKIAAAMSTFVAHPGDPAAAAVLSADPEYIGQVRTTCVATTLTGGHAYNALPQKASVSINCRIFPGVPIDTVKTKLLEIAADPKVTIATLFDPKSSDASPLDPKVMAAARKALDLRYPGVEIVPSMSAGASDSLYYRAVGVPSYGVSTVFIKPTDDYSHGLNERVPLDNVPGSLAQWESMIKDLAK